MGSVRLIGLSIRTILTCVSDQISSSCGFCSPYRIVDLDHLTCVSDQISSSCGFGLPYRIVDLDHFNMRV